MTNGDSVFNPKKCDIPDVAPIDPIPDLEDCDVPVAPDAIIDCPSPTIPVTGVTGPKGLTGASIPGTSGGTGPDGQDGQDGQDGLQGSDGLPGVLNTNGCCVWTWCECDESLSIPTAEAPVDLSCPKDDTCIDAPGRWLLQSDLSDIDCSSAFPPCDVGKFYGQTRLQCEAPPEESVSPPAIITNCTGTAACCDVGSIFDQMIVEIPNSIWANLLPDLPCDACNTIGGTYIVELTDDTLTKCFSVSGQGQSCNGTELCVRWFFREELCEVTKSGFGTNCFVTDNLDLYIDVHIQCDLFGPPRRCQHTVCVFLIDRQLQNPDLHPLGAVVPVCISGDVAIYSLVSIPQRDCSAPLVLPLTFDTDSFCDATHPASVTLKGP